jgi:pimeloyl-ACP methyl ester carboxylesterase
MTMSDTSVVLVHGGFVDGSGWEPVYHLLRSAGHQVSVVQNPTKSLTDDVAVTSRVLDQHENQVVLVGHSYGGAVITEAGNHPNVDALVYISAFAPDAGESVNTLIAGFPPDGPQPPILPPVDGFLFLDKEKFPGSFAGDVEASKAAFMADSQVPWSVDALGGEITEAAWASKPAWYLVTNEDRMIPPTAQRTMASRAGASITDVNASHSVYVSQPEAVAGIITAAIDGAR